MKRIKKITEKIKAILRWGLLYAVVFVTWVESPAREIQARERNPETGGMLAARSISANCANKLVQAPGYSIQNDHYSLTSVKPSVDLVGELVFTHADNMAGTATVTVSLSDNCGSVNGVRIGVDQVIITTETF